MYFNEHDRFAAQWLRNLWPNATVDERDIRDVCANDVLEFERCHFFGGIGGWEYALQLAEWPQERSVWTGSCPCQPFSAAGKRKGVDDERHLWPAWFRLIRECRPDCIIGEQVESAIGHGWLDGVSADLEAEGYAIGAVVLGAHSVAAPHVRRRVFWVAESDSGRCAAGELSERPGRQDEAAIEQSGSASRLRNAGCLDRKRRRECRHMAEAGSSAQEETQQREWLWNAVSDCGSINGMVNEPALRREGSSTKRLSRGPWERYVVIACADGNSRRISTERGDEPLAYGIPRDVGQRIPELRPLAKSARANRVGRLRGYGNAIVSQVAAEFIRAYLEVE